MFTVTSSNIDAIDYSIGDRTMTVKFKGGKTYLYRNVEAETFLKILKADSVGSTFHELVKSQPDRYPYSTGV